MTRSLTLAEIQEVRERFTTLTRWTGLPIPPDRLDGLRVVVGNGVPSLLRFVAPTVDADGVLQEYTCYTPSLRRFALRPVRNHGPWRISENTIGVMVNPTDLSATAFAEACYRYLLAREADEPFIADWLDDPVLWPKRLNRPDDLELARRVIEDLRPTETVVIAHDLLGIRTFTARLESRHDWGTLDWRDEQGRSAKPDSGVESIGGLRTWRVFLDGFLDHVVPFTLDALGKRATGDTRGAIRPAPVLIVGVDRTGRTDWAEGKRAETLVADPDEWARILDGLAWVPGADLLRGGLAPRTARAMRAGRLPIKRNAEVARALVAKRVRADAGLDRDRARRCIAQDCGERLRGRQQTFCARHAAYPGARRKARKVAAER